jgi:uncharacterized protein YjbJ (UPF0337 family)
MRIRSEEAILKRCGEFTFTQQPSRKRPNRTRQAQRINNMKSSTTDKVKGTAKEVTGKVKEEAGKAIGDRNLQERGTAQKFAGKVERKVGDVKKVFGK